MVKPDNYREVPTPCYIVEEKLLRHNLEILRRYYDEHSGSGFDYAYRYPGMNKVLQAAGRVIRTAEDKGVVLLLDDRFARSEYTRLFPRHWRHLKYLKGTEQLKEELATFW